MAVWNPRQDSRGRWLSGTVVQKLGPSNYLVNVNGQARYVHVDHILHRDIRSFPQDVHQEQTSNTHDCTVTMITPQAGSYFEVSAEKIISSTDSTREDSVPTTPSHPELTERQSEQTDNMPTKKPIEKSAERENRRYPTRNNRRPPRDIERFSGRECSRVWDYGTIPSTH